MDYHKNPGVEEEFSIANNYNALYLCDGMTG